MMFSSKTAAASLAAAGFMVLAGSVSAAVTDIDSVVIVERNWDDFPNSTLVTTNTYPTTVQFDESSFDPPDLSTNLYANQHQAWFSADAGATRYAFQNNEGWELSVDVNLDSLVDGSRRKEAGIRMDTKIGGEGIFMVTTDGEIASFGSFFPFNSTNSATENFGGSVTPYVTGTTVNLKLVYTPGDGVAATVPATMEFFVDGLSGGSQDISNLENGVIDGSELGFYAQNAIDADNIATDAVVTTFSNISLTPLSAGLEGDLNDDGFVGIDDLNIVLGNWNATVTAGDPLSGDPSGDGFVGIDDLNEVLGNWNAGTPIPASFVPEPATLGLIALGGVALLRRK